jgi:hypothetical protein
MKSALDSYHEFVDELVARKSCVLANRVAEGATWPSSSELAEFNAFLGSLSMEQREQASRLLTKAREGGIHDSLVVLSERMNLKGLRLVENGVALPNEPHGTEIYFDWVARCAGEPWPNDR